MFLFLHKLLKFQSLSTSILDRNMWGGIIFAVVPIFCVMFVSITLLISLAVIRHRLKQNNDPFSLGRRHRDKRPKSKKRFSSVTGGSSSMLSSFVSDSTQSIAIAMRHSSKRRMSFSFAAALAQRLANDPGDIDEQFWQCVCFVSGFFICWPIYAVGIMVKNLPYGVWILIALLAPLQGFLNCLTYFRPRVLERLDPQNSHRRRRRSFDETAVDDSTSAARLGRSNTLDSSLRSVGGSGKRMGSLEPNGRASSSLDSSGKRFSGLDSNIDGYDGDDFIEEGDGDSGLLSRIEEENSKFMEMEEEESKQMER